LRFGTSHEATNKLSVQETRAKLNGEEALCYAAAQCDFAPRSDEALKLGGE
jgi:hypothetical protein